MPGELEITWSGCVESAQKPHGLSDGGAASGTSSPVMTQERVIGSLRNSIDVGKHWQVFPVNSTPAQALSITETSICPLL